MTLSDRESTISPMPAPASWPNSMQGRCATCGAQSIDRRLAMQMRSELLANLNFALLTKEWQVADKTQFQLAPCGSLQGHNLYNCLSGSLIFTKRCHCHVSSSCYWLAYYVPLNRAAADGLSRQGQLWGSLAYWLLWC